MFTSQNPLTPKNLPRRLAQSSTGESGIVKIEGSPGLERLLPIQVAICPWQSNLSRSQYSLKVPSKKACVLKACVKRELGPSPTVNAGSSAGWKPGLSLHRCLLKPSQSGFSNPLLSVQSIFSGKPSRLEARSPPVGSTLPINPPLPCRKMPHSISRGS